MDFHFIVGILPVLIRATGHTIVLSVLSLIVSLFLAVIISSVIYYDIEDRRASAESLCFFFQGTPALCQLYMIYFGLGNLGIPFFAKMSAYTAVVAALSLNMSA